RCRAEDSTRAVCADTKHVRPYSVVRRRSLGPCPGSLPRCCDQVAVEGHAGKMGGYEPLAEPLIDGVFSFVDGKNLRMQEPSSTDLQNAMYNGWLLSVFVTGGLCFGLDGTLVWGRHNFPGSWSDGEMSRRLQEILADPTKIGVGMKVASDSAFPVSGRCAGRIVTPLKKWDLERHPPACRLGLKVMSDITSLRQATVWGMGAVSKVYRQLLLPLLYIPSLRAMLLDSMFKLYKIRVRRTWISQIKNVFGL
ncbi:hypothetical protein H257_19566, partial [Aphanomyces astaci]